MKRITGVQLSAFNLVPIVTERNDGARLVAIIHELQAKNPKATRCYDRDCSGCNAADRYPKCIQHRKNDTLPYEDEDGDND